MRSWYGLLVVVGILFTACGQSGSPQEPKPVEPVPDKPAVAQPVPAPAQGEGTIVGEILFKGVSPAPKRVAVNKDKEACGDYKDSEELVVGPNKGIRWAVVSLRSHPKEMRWEGTTLDQKGCRFAPHVRLIPAGSKLTILNPDGVLHNFHTFSEINPPVNKAQPKFKKRDGSYF